MTQNIDLNNINTIKTEQDTSTKATNFRNNFNKIKKESEEVLKKIQEYLKKENISSSVIDPYNLDVQTFSYESKSYNLEKKHCDDIRNIILDITNKHIVSRTFSREPKTLRHGSLMKDISAIVKAITNFEFAHKEKFRAIPIKVLEEILQRIFSKIINENIVHYANTNFLENEECKAIKVIPLNRLIQLLGSTILEVFIKQTCFRKPSPDYVKKKTRKGSVYENVSLSKDDAIELNNILNYSKEKIPSFLDYKKYLTYEITTVEELSLIKELVSHYSQLKCESDRSINFFTNGFSEETQKIIYEIGFNMVSVMEKNGFMKKVFLDIKNNDIIKKNIPHMELTKNLLEIVNPPLSMNRPLLYRREYHKSYSKDIINKEGIKITIGYDKNSPEYLEKDCEKIISKPSLLNVLNASSNVPFTITDIPDNIFAVCDIVYLYVEKNDLLSETIINFIKATYVIDLRPILVDRKGKHTSNERKELLKDLVCYGLDIYKNNDKELFKRVRNDLSCLDVYNKLTARKYYLYLALSNALIFKHFKFIFLEKYVASTGRIFTAVDALQMQGHKVIKSFLVPAPQRVFDKNKFDVLRKILQEIFPDVLFDNCNSYESFVADNKQLYLDYLKKMFIEGKENSMDTFKNISNLEERLSWLNNHIKKSENIWLAHSMLQAYFKNDYLHHIINLDATKSGLQIISRITGNGEFAKLVNLVGNETYDLHKQSSRVLKNEIAKIHNYVNKDLTYFLENFEQKYPEDFRKLNRFLDITKNNEKKFCDDYTANNRIIKIFSEQAEKELLSLNTNMPYMLEFRPHYSIPYGKHPIYHIINHMIILKHFSYLARMFNPYITEKIMKYVTMTISYNAGIPAHRKQFFEFIKEKMIAFGIKIFNKKEVTYLASCLQRVIKKHLEFQYGIAYRFAKNMDIFAQNKILAKEPISFSSLYLSWTLERYLYEIHHVTLKYMQGEGNEKIHRFDVKASRGVIDEKTLRQALSALYIQSIDALIVYQLYDYYDQINNKLQSHGLPLIFFQTNHDAYLIITQYGALLRKTFMYSFDNIVHTVEKQIPELINSEGNGDWKTTNPNCIA